MTVAESKLVSENIANNIAAKLIRLFVFMAGFSQIFSGGGMTLCGYDLGIVN
jgi:hypothetical protein